MVDRTDDEPALPGSRPSPPARTRLPRLLAGLNGAQRDQTPSNGTLPPPGSASTSVGAEPGARPSPPASSRGGQGRARPGNTGGAAGKAARLAAGWPPGAAKRGTSSARSPLGHDTEGTGRQRRRATPAGRPAVRPGLPRVPASPSSSTPTRSDAAWRGLNAPLTRLRAALPGPGGLRHRRRLDHRRHGRADAAR